MCKMCVVRKNSIAHDVFAVRISVVYPRIIDYSN